MWKGCAMVPRTVSLKSLGRQVAQCLERHGIAVDALYLFGSCARLDATEQSDIDILLVSPQFQVRGFWPRCQLVGTALSELSDPVEVYPVTSAEFLNPEPGGFLESIRADLKPLYRRARRVGPKATAVVDSAKRPP
jgi:predicted nucleotidyltransferase